MGKKHIKRQIKFIRQLIFPFVQIILMFQTAFISPVAFANAKFRCASIAPKGSSFEKILQDISDKIKEKTGVEIAAHC